MSPTIGLPPPEPESCLVHSRASRFKGGTLINEEVRDLESHNRRIVDPDGYRPDACPRCLHPVLHVHSYRERRPRGDMVVRIVQYLCAHESCGAIWRVLPLFLGRHLWWAWRVVERAVEDEDGRASPDRSPVPKQTRRRWRARLASSARVLLALFAARGHVDIREVAVNVGTDATRAAVVERYADRTRIVAGERLAGIATLAHQLERGIRLM
jgi:hypothetical protein